MPANPHDQPGRPAGVFEGMDGLVPGAVTRTFLSDGGVWVSELACGSVRLAAEHLDGGGWAYSVDGASRYAAIDPARGFIEQIATGAKDGVPREALAVAALATCQGPDLVRRNDPRLAAAILWLSERGRDDVAWGLGREAARWPRCALSPARNPGSRGAAADDVAALHAAARVGDVAGIDAAVAAGCDPAAEGPSLETAAHVAARHGHTRAVRRLVEDHGTPVDAADGEWRTPLHEAAEAGDVGTVTALLGMGARSSLPDRQWCLPMHLAARAGHTEAARALISLGDADAAPDPKDGEGHTPLLLAARGGFADLVSLFLEQGASPDHMGLGGQPAASVAAQHGRLDALRVFERCLGPRRIVEAQGVNGASALLCAVRGGRLDVVRELLRMGARPGACDLNGRTPVLDAAASGRLECLRCLCAAGGHGLAKARTRYGDSPLTLAARSGHTEVVRELVGMGCDPDGSASNEQHPAEAAIRARHDSTAELLLESHVFQAGSEEDRRLVGAAAEANSVRLIDFLARRGADVMSADSDGGETALHQAAMRDSVDVAQRLLFPPGGPALDPDVRDATMATPLRWAADGNRFKVFCLLIDAGADPHAEDDCGTTPFSRLTQDGPPLAAQMRAYVTWARRRMLVRWRTCV